MLAVERLLEREPALRRRIRFIQIVVPSREKVEEYESLRRQLDEIVGRINGAYATVTSVPVNYLYRAIPERELIALYCAADVALVTPLRDGMNLVAKEFVACRNDEDGVLVLSEFAGAAAELSEALIVNPYDIDQVASAIKEALAMPPAQRQSRMQVLRRRVKANTSIHWFGSFVEALHSTEEGLPVVPPLSSATEIDGLLEKACAADRLLVLLDYDGTLIPFFDEPQRAAPDGELLDLIEMLAARPGTTVHIVSGRTRETLEQWLGHLPVGLHAEHGVWSLTPERSWISVGEQPTDWKIEALPIIQRFTEATPGSLIEEKSAGVGWHYRMADPEFGFLHARELRAVLETELGRWGVDLLAGDKVIELRARGVDKGTIVSRLMAQHGSGATLLAIGDDQTDEDMFAMLPEGSLSVHVGPQPSRAQYRLGEVSHVRNFLRSLATRSQTPKEDTSSQLRSASADT
jgi:trehalose 6-phosphate synthase/phosphatase